MRRAAAPTRPAALLLFLLLPARRASFLRPVSSELLEIANIKLGPPLNGIDGRKSGTFEGFNYSPANKSSGITWSEETFPKYIRAPMQEMPGTRMAFVGIKNDKDIADLWACLKQFGADGTKK